MTIIKNEDGINITEYDREEFLRIFGNFSIDEINERLDIQSKTTNGGNVSYRVETTGSHRYRFIVSW